MFFKLDINHKTVLLVVLYREYDLHFKTSQTQFCNTTYRIQTKILQETLIIKMQQQNLDSALLKRRWTEEPCSSSSSSFRDPPYPGPSSNGDNYQETGPSAWAHFSESDSDEEKPYDRESLLRDIDADINKIISTTNKDKDVKEEAKIKIKKEENMAGAAAAVASNYRGADGALYTLEIFMRDKRTCRLE